MEKKKKKKTNKQKSSQFPAYEEASNFPVPEVPPLSSYTVATMYFLHGVFEVICPPENPIAKCLVK